MYLRNSNKLKKICLVVLIMSIFFPYSFQGIKIVGITLTTQRLVMPIILAYCFYIKKGIFLYKKNSMLYQWIIFLLLWITLGTVLMGICDYISIKSGIKEILSLVYGVLLLFMLSILIENKEELEFSFKVVRIMCIFFVLFGIIEILTGFHFVNSIYYDEEAIYLKYISRGLEIDNRMATGFFYGVNDFASFLGVFSVFLFVKNKTISDKILNLIVLTLLIIILVVNDANIVLTAVVLGEATYVYLNMIKSNLKKKICIAFGVIMILSTVVCLYCTLGGKIALGDGVLANQFENYQLNQGSLFARITIYKDAFEASLKNYFMGYGPASFMNYFSQNKSKSGLVNPHALVFEILFQYGGLVLLVFCGLVYALIKKNLVFYIKNREKEYLIILISLIIYILVSFSPSSFLTYVYQWIPISLASLNISLESKEKWSI